MAVTTIRAQTEEYADQQAAGKELGDGDIGEKAEDHHGNRGRNDDADRPAGGHHRSGKGRRIALADHCRDGDGADGGGIGGGRAGDPGKKHRGDDTGAGQAARQPAHQAVGKVDDPP